MKNIKNFIERWKDKGDEKSEAQKFWIEFFHDVLEVDEPTKFADFEKDVKLEDKHMGYIDVYIPSTKVIIEQKSSEIALDKPSRVTKLTPFQQAKHYSDWLPASQHADWIITCNFQEFQVHDMEHPKADPEIIYLKDLEEEAENFSFLIDAKALPPKERRKEKLSIEAGRLVEKLKKSLETRYENPDNDEYLQKKNERSLTIFCVRIVFLLYAEDAELEGQGKKFQKGSFHDYLTRHKDSSRNALISLFAVLSTKIEKRDRYLDADLAAFPYVNGGLFSSDENIVIPQLDGEPLEIILHDMSESFDWRGINPTIFGAIFERVLGGERASGGMHYTTVKNIHKVIDPLFLDDLKAELENIFVMPQGDERTQKLIDFQEKLSKLRFLDPACGSGNFLTESFISLRTLENKILQELKEAGIKTEIKVLISQFHGIEVEPFAAAVASTALWIADNQMLKEAKGLTKKNPLPLENYHHIKIGSAMDALDGLAWGLPGWKIYHEDRLYIMGNPPFIGRAQQNLGQKQDVINLFGKGIVDYVACWFAIASEYVQDKSTKAAFVATNSITQGEQVALIFKYLVERWKIKIDFAYQSFKWDSEIKDKKAQVYVVVIGFSTNPPKLKKLFTPIGLKLVENINFYLKPAPNIFIELRKTPISQNAPLMTMGNMPADGGNLILDKEEFIILLENNPKIKKFIRRFMMGNEFINGIKRYCLWLVDATPDEIKKFPFIYDRVQKCQKIRLKSSQSHLADKPHLFRTQMNPVSYIAIPSVSSERRFYIPIDYLDVSVIPGNKLYIIPGANLYHFGVLTSCVHMAWTRAVCGRLGTGYNYSGTVVYNNFPWPTSNEKQKSKIEKTAQKILDVRAKFSESSLATLYDDTTMPAELRKAHRENDAAVCEAYGFDKNISEEEIVSKLFDLYERLLNNA